MSERGALILASKSSHAHCQYGSTREGTTGTRDADAAAIAAKARNAWVEVWTAIRWDYFVRLRWHREAIDAASANAHLERLQRDLHRTQPMLRLVAGVHSDPYPHAHGLVHLSRTQRAQVRTADECREWLQPFWYHGTVWAQVYDATRRSPDHGGAIEYLAREPGSVVWG